MGIKCDANVLSDKEEDVDFDIIPNANDTITVKYVPPGAGRLTIKVLFTDQVSNIARSGSKIFGELREMSIIMYIVFFFFCTM